MTDAERKYFEDCAAIYELLRERNMKAFALVRIARKLCSCGSCKWFEQHYSKDGDALDWGHCFHGNTQRSKKLNAHPCGSWTFEGEE